MFVNHKQTSFTIPVQCACKSTNMLPVNGTSTSLFLPYTHSFSNCMTLMAAHASRPVVGSSKQRMFGDVTSSIPMPALFFSPPDTPLVYWLPIWRYGQLRTRVTTVRVWTSGSECVCSSVWVSVGVKEMQECTSVKCRCCECTQDRHSVRVCTRPCTVCVSVSLCTCWTTQSNWSLLWCWHTGSVPAL